MQSRTRNTLISIGAVLLLSSCGFNSQWRAHYDAAEKALASNTPDRLQTAEKELLLAIEVGWKDRVPEKELVGTYAKVGDVMMEQKKYAEAPMYLLRAIQFNDVLHVSADENIAQLKKLITAYEKSRNYEEAAQTQNVLVHLIEAEKSPLDPSYPVAQARLEELKQKLAQFNAPIEGQPSKEQIAREKQSPTDKADGIDAASLLQGWH